MEPSKKFNHRIGSRIRAIREEKKLKQEWLAKKVSLGKSEISRIENGKRSITLIKLHEIADALDTPPYYFFEIE
jgi:transcriptional regulator with XRE-family HTH domain